LIFLDSLELLLIFLTFDLIFGNWNLALQNQVLDKDGVKTLKYKCKRKTYMQVLNLSYFELVRYFSWLEFF